MRTMVSPALDHPAALRFYGIWWLLAVILQAELAGHGHAAYVVDAGIYDAFACDLDEDRGGEPCAIERAHGEGEIGALCVRAREELRSQFDLGRAFRPADSDAPLRPAGRRHRASEFSAQVLRRLLEGEAPEIEHVAVISRSYAAGHDVEMRVLIRVQPHHLPHWQKDADQEHERRHRWRSAPRPRQRICGPDEG